MKAIKTEHNGDKGSAASAGYYGRRAEAKRVSRKLRRRNDKREIKTQLTLA